MCKVLRGESSDDAQRRAHWSDFFSGYCTISLFLEDVVGVKTQGGQYSAYGEANLHKLYLMGHQPIAVWLAAGRRRTRA